MIARSGISENPNISGEFVLRFPNWAIEALWCVADIFLAIWDIVVCTIPQRLTTKAWVSNGPACCQFGGAPLLGSK